MQRIVHVTTSHDATDNRIFHKECRSLAAAGYNVTLIAPHDRDETIDGIRIIALPRVEGLRRRITTLPPRALRACRATSADLYHFHDPELIPFMARLKRSGVPLVYDMHENIAADIPAKRYVPRALKPLVRNVLPRLLRGWLLGMHVVFAVKEFPALYPWIDSSAVVQNLFKLDNLPQNIPAKPERFTVGYLGGMTAVRGCLQTLDVLAGLQRDGLYIGYEAVGPEMEGRMAEYEAAVRSHGLRHVNFTGELPLHDAYAHVAQCHAGLLLFQPSPNHDNCCPNKLFEYMALGLPVVASNFSLISEVVEGTGCGLTVDPLDTGEISAAIRTLAADPAAAAEMGGRGRRAVREHYSWESAEKNLLELYARVLGKQ